jgi:hypothetical protein
LHCGFLHSSPPLRNLYDPKVDLDGLRKSSLFSTGI